jgi:hypothetical protein
LLYSFLLPPLIYLIYFRKSGRNSKVLTLIYYCVSIFLFLFINDNFAIIPRKINFPLFTLLEYTFFAILIVQQLKLPRLKLIILILSVFFFLFQIIYFIAQSKNILDSAPLFLSDFINWFGIVEPNKNNLDSIPIGIEAILIFVFIFFFLYEQLIDVKDLPIYVNYFFWIAIGLLIYLGGSLFIYIYANSLSPQEIDRYWFFTYIVETIKNLLFAAAVVIHSKKPKPKKSTQALPNLDFTL